MGTSNWQQIPFCVEAMMRIEPKRVLDIGVGFGRWGMITREFCDVWFGRVLRSRWDVRVEGVEAFKKNIDKYHSYFYDKIHVGDLRDIQPKLKDRWNLIIFGDVLEHFEKDEGIQLLHWALETSDYVLVNIPLGDNWPQEDSYDNPYERHLSLWTAEEFEPFSLRRCAFFRDFGDRPFGTFILSEADPRGLACQLFSRSTANASDFESIDDGCDLAKAELKEHQRTPTEILQADLQQARRELADIRNTVGYRIVSRLRNSRAFPLLHKMAHTAVRCRAALRPKSSRLRLGPSTGRAADQRWEFSQKDPENPVVAICHPRWQGTRSSAEGQTPNVLLAPESGPTEIEAMVDCLESSGATHFIANGLFRGYAHLLRRIRKRMPYAGIFYLHHGSFFQMLEDPSLPALLAQVSRLRQQGIIDRIGFCKAGMAEAFDRLGVPAFEVMNRVSQHNVPPRTEWNTPASVLIPLGAQLRKNPHTQLMGALLCEDIDEIHLTCDLDLEYLPKSTLTRAKVKVHGNVDREATMRLMRQSNVVLYATISECAPMVPLESFALGVPCLTGDNHGLFDQSPTLSRQLLISRADDPWAIAKAISSLRRDYGECCDEIRAFNGRYDCRAEQSLNDFLGLHGCKSEEGQYVRCVAG